MGGTFVVELLGRGPRVHWSSPEKEVELIRTLEKTGTGVDGLKGTKGR